MARKNSLTLKDQHPNFNQSASNGVLASLNENTCSGCIAFKIFISILFIGFDDMKSSPFVDEIHWAVEYLNWQPVMLLMFAPTKTAQLFRSDAPRSWFKLACVKEREFVDVLCSTASVVNSPPLDVGFSSKWCEPEESEFGCFISTGRWSRKMLVKFYGTPFSSCRVNLRLECSLVAIFSPLLRLRLTFINPNKHFPAILERNFL